MKSLLSIFNLNLKKNEKEKVNLSQPEFSPILPAEKETRRETVWIVTNFPYHARMCLRQLVKEDDDVDGGPETHHT